MISVEEFVDRLCRVGAGPVPRPFPRARRDREILVESILMSFDSSGTYREGEVNDLLETWRREVAPAIETDHVTLRRMLVDYGRLERTADGRFYRVAFPQRMTAFEMEIYDLDLRSTVAAYRDDVEKRRQKSRAAASESVSKPKKSRRK